MTSKSIIARIPLMRKQGRSRKRSNLHDLAHNPELLPSFVRHSPVVIRYLELLSPLAWERFPERDLALGCHMRPVPYAAFDAFYVYEYFHRNGQHDLESAFAAVPFSDRGGHKLTFDQHGLPLCKAGLPMPLRYTFWSKTTLIHHQRGRYICLLLFPEQTREHCPINHRRWPKGGCTTTIPTSIGTRIRYQLDRQGEAYKQVYKQRTANERVNSQAVELGIERPKLRNGRAIANLNTLICVLINLRALHRIRRRKAKRSMQAVDT